MNVIEWMIPMALSFAGLFVIAFFWATSQGQFDDLETPALRILKDDSNFKQKNKPASEPSPVAQNEQERTVH